MAGWTTIWILREPLWLLLLIPVIPIVYYLARRPTLEKKLPWGFLCQPIETEHQPSRRGKVNWVIFCTATAGASLLVFLLAGPMSSKGKVFLFQPQWTESIDGSSISKWESDLTSTWPPGVSPAYYTQWGGPYELEELKKPEIIGLREAETTHQPRDFSFRVHPFHRGRKTHFGDLAYPTTKSLSIHDLVYVSRKEVLLQVHNSTSILPTITLNGKTLSAERSDGSVTTYRFPPPSSNPSHLVISNGSSLSLPQLILPKVISGKDLPSFPQKLQEHPPFLNAYRSIPWTIPLKLSTKLSSLNDVFKVLTRHETSLSSPPGLPLQMTSSSTLSSVGEHIGLNWPILGVPNHVLRESDDLPLFSIGRHPIVTRPIEGLRLPWNMSFDPLVNTLLSPRMEKYFWKLLLQDAFDGHWEQLPVFPKSPPIISKDNLPQEVSPPPRALLWFVGVTLILLSVSLHLKSVHPKPISSRKLSAS